jgi:hypothetical protein
LAEERVVVEAQTCGLLGDIDIDCRSGEERGDDQRELPCKDDGDSCFIRRAAT